MNTKKIFNKPGRPFTVALGLVLSLFFCLPSRAQFYSHSLRAEAAIPRPLSNAAFSNSFVGIYDVGLRYLFHIGPGIQLGIGGRFTDFQVNRNKFFPIRDTHYNLGSANVVLGYDFKLSPKQVLTVSVSGGQAFNWIKGSGLDTLDASQFNKQALFFEPSLSWYFFFDENLAVGAHLSYYRYASGFDPYTVGFNRFERFTGTQLNGNVSSLNLGICLLVGFKGKRFKSAQFPDYGQETEPEFNEP